jgi:RimJ/RimL family protein N-acetyltransferase
MLLEFPLQFSSLRLLLRCYEPGDGPMYLAVAEKNRQHLQRFEAGNALMTIDTPERAEIVVREMHAAWQSREYFFLGAFENHSGEFAAQVYIGPVNWETPEFEIGYIADVAHEGQGYVSEAVRAALDFIFTYFQAHRVRIRCDDTNMRSWKVAERCGFLLEGRLRENRRNPDGSFSTERVYGLLRSEYEGFRGEAKPR